MDESRYTQFAELIQIFLSDLAAQHPLETLLSDDTLEQLSRGEVPEKLAFNRDALLNAVINMLENYLNDSFEATTKSQ